jgi:hypothetical protein
MLIRASRGATLVAALTGALAMPAAAQAAAKPAVTTGGAANIQPQTARLTGTVDPNQADTTYQFQYGTTTAYGATTAEATVTGDGKKTVTADLAGLAPATRYHYRLIARNSVVQTLGADRSFKTKPQPLGVSLAATPNPIPFGLGTTLAGTLTGTGNAGQEVLLQSNPFPFTQGFKPAANRQVTNAQGGFAFPILTQPVTTQYRIVLPGKPGVVSPIVTASVSVIVRTTLGTTRVRRGGRLTFKGTLRPAVDGTPIAIQKRRGSRWVTVAGTVARHSNSSQSKYSKKVRVPRGGTYRVYAGVANGSYVPNTGREVKVRTHR